MTQPTLVFTGESSEGAAAEIVVNFGVYSGRLATPAEIERLAGSLLTEIESVEIICEQRYVFDREVEASVYRIRVEIAAGADRSSDALRGLVEDWAADCIGERRVSAP